MEKLDHLRHYATAHARRVAALLVLVSAIISSCQIYWHTFLDESENLYFGYLMSRGAVLYADMFSHHFPFPYWWVAVVTAVAGRSITAVRLSLVAFQLIAFATALRVSMAPLAVATGAMVWSLVGYLYFGNLLIAYTFKALSMAVLVSGILLRSDRDWPGAGRLIAMGIFGSIAVLTDPTAVYLVLTIVGMAWLRFGWRAALWICAPGALAAGGTLAWLHLAGNLTDFWEYAIRFNREVYGVLGRKNATPLTVIFPYDGVFRQSMTGLKIFDARWWAPVPSTGLALPGALHDRWVFTGLAFRLYFILAFALLVRAKEWSRAVGIYAIAALTLALRGEEGFHSSTFALGAILCGGAILSGELLPPTGLKPPRTIRVGVAFALLLLASAGGATLWNERSSLRYETNFAYYEDLGRKVDRWTCSDPSVRVSFWPSDLLVNWYGDRRPVSKHTYALPWTLAISQPEIEASLRRERSVIIVDLDGSVGPFKNVEYLNNLLRAVKTDLVELERGVFASRGLVDCQRNQAESSSGFPE